jgi:pyrroline-5-carboxylate reductase
LNQLQIAFIGAGNMASSIIGGLLDQGLPAANIRASDPNPQSLQQLLQLAPIGIAASNSEAVRDADVVILAVKPQVMKAVLADIRDAIIEQRALVISIAAGITIASMEQGLDSTTALVRCMPNTPALLGLGATALFANANAGSKQCTSAESILSAVGDVHWVAQETLLDAVTALSGSGPAYFFLFMEAMATAGAELGLDADTSRALAIQTAVGASHMAEGDVELEELRRRVTSPGGTTQAAIESFERNGLRTTINSAMTAAYDRAQEMAAELG